jgi:hypothetical protein
VIVHATRIADDAVAIARSRTETVLMYRAMIRFTHSALCCGVIDADVPIDITGEVVAELRKR